MEWSGNQANRKLEQVYCVVQAIPKQRKRQSIRFDEGLSNSHNLDTTGMKVDLISIKLYNEVKLLGQSHHNFELIMSLLDKEIKRVCCDPHLYPINYLRDLIWIVDHEAVDFRSFTNWQSEDDASYCAFDRFTAALLTALDTKFRP